MPEQKEKKLLIVQWKGKVRGGEPGEPGWNPYSYPSYRQLFEANDEQDLKLYLDYVFEDNARQSPTDIKSIREVINTREVTIVF